MKPKTELEKFQVLKLLNSVECNKKDDITRLVNNGVFDLINYNELNDGKTALIKAIELNNEELVNYLITLGANPELPDLNLKTPIMYACELGFDSIVQNLSKLDVNLNKIDKFFNTALIYCLSSTKRHLRCLEILLSNSAININLETLKGTVFLEACKMNFEAIAIKLTQKGADINIIDKNTNNHAIHYAVKFGMMSLCYKLIMAKINIDIVNSNLQTPVIMAAKFGHLNVLKLLFSFGANFDAIDLKGFNAIFYAVARKDGKMVKYLASRGTNPKFKNTEGLSPIKLSKIVKLRMRKRIFKHANQLYDEWESKFMISQKQNTINDIYSFSLDSIRERLQWLLRIYEFINSDKIKFEEILNENALIDDKTLITQQSLFDVIKKYLSDKIPSHVLEHLVSTLTKNKNLDVIEIKSVIKCEGLLKVLNIKLPKNKKKFRKKKRKLKIHKIRKTKVKIFIPVKTNERNLNEINQFQKVRILREISNHKTDNILQNDTIWYRDNYEYGIVEFSNLINSGNLSSLDDLIQRQKNPKLTQKLLNTIDRFYKSPLIIAIQKNDLKIVEYLLNNNVDVNYKDNFKWTPLHHAAFTGNTEIAVKLINRGANTNSKSVTGITPIMLAVKTNNQKMIELLLKNKSIFFDPANLKKQNPLEIANAFAFQSPILNKFQEKFKKIKKSKTNRHLTRNIKQNTKKINKKLVPAKMSPLKYKYRLIRHDKNLRLKQVKSDCAKIKLPLQITQDRDDKTKLIELAVKNRQIHGWEYDFPDFKSPWQRNLERIMILRK
jgi:ankyrin repeat protein